MTQQNNSAHADLLNQQKNKLLTLALTRTIDDEHTIQRILEEPFLMCKRVTAAIVYSVEKENKEVYADFLGRHTSNDLMYMCRNYFSSQMPSLVIRRFIDETEDGDRFYYSIPDHFLFDEILNAYIQYRGTNPSVTRVGTTALVIWIIDKCVYNIGLGELSAIFDPIVDKMSAEFFTGSSVNMI